MKCKAKLISVEIVLGEYDLIKFKYIDFDGKECTSEMPHVGFLAMFDSVIKKDFKHPKNVQLRKLQKLRKQEIKAQQ